MCLTYLFYTTLQRRSLVRRLSLFEIRVLDLSIAAARGASRRAGELERRDVADDWTPRGLSRKSQDTGTGTGTLDIRSLSESLVPSLRLRTPFS